MLLQEYKKGSNITILNTYYDKQYRENEAGYTTCDDSMIIVYKDNDTNEKKVEVIEKPNYTYYQATYDVEYISDDKLHKFGEPPTKEEQEMIDSGKITLEDWQTKFPNKLFIERKNVKPITVRYSQLEKSLAKNSNHEEFYRENIENGDRKQNKKLHALPQFFMSDININNYYRYIFNKEYANEYKTPTKAYFDIEVDGINAVDDFVHLGECPINAIAFYNESTNTIVQFLLRDKKNPLIQQYENDLLSGKIDLNYIRNFIKASIGGWKQMRRLGLENVDVKFRFYDDEIQLIKEFFAMVHLCSPDFIMSYNGSSFDIPYIIERCNVLGYNPEDIMSDPRWKKRIVYHYIDHNNEAEPAKRADSTFISGFVVWLDQMIQFASIRKNSISTYKSLKLDDIGEAVAHIKKLDYSHITYSVVELPYLNYKIFSLYNIMDVIVQYGIESVTKDIDYVFTKSLATNTSYGNVHQQTNYLTNKFTLEWEKLGYIIGNNINRWNIKPDAKYAGALVHDGRKTDDYPKMKINGVSILICCSLQDFDYKSLYPSIVLEFNIAPNTQIGRIDIPDKIYANENAFNNDKYFRGGEFIENMVCDNIIEFCHRWLHLANFKEALDDMNEYFRIKYVTYSNFDTHSEFNYNEKDKQRYITPLKNEIHDSIDVIYNDNEKGLKIMYFMEERPKGETNESKYDINWNLE